MAQRSNTHSIEAERRFEARSTEQFDRVAYTLELLEVLKPQLTVGVYGTLRHMHVEQGRLSSKGPWALFGVPPHATRESIVQAVVELSGVGNAPFLVDLLSAKPVAPRD